jgi:hypothetical protein
MAWINPAASQNNPFSRIINKINSSNGYLLHIGETSPSVLAWNVYSSNTLRQTAQGGSIQHNTWQHVAATYNGQVGKIYVNGVLVRTLDFGSVLNMGVDSSPLFIGSSNGTNRFFNGNIAAVHIHNTVLTDNEIATNFAALRGRFGI